MSKSSKSYIGLDVHKDSIDIAIAESGESSVSLALALE